MHPEKEHALEHRVANAAEAALAHHHYVSAIDVLTGMGLLSPTHVQDWRKGRIDFLERVIHANLKKISLSMALFRQWAQAKGLKPSETRYVRRDRGGAVDLQFSKSGNPHVERSYRTHFVSPELSERKKAKLKERLSRVPERVVSQILRESCCSECGIELEQGDLLYMEADQPLCLACAGLGDLGYLPAGDAALTRRAAKHSARTAVVVRFSRSRGRVGRTAAGRALEGQALVLAVTAAVRHRRTQYDALLAGGLDRVLAREQVRDQVEETLVAWRRPTG